MALLGVLEASAAPGLSGIYRAGEVGLLLLHSEGEQLRGTFVGGGACHFEVDQPVLEGAFEGNVLTGTIALCQAGEGCANRSYPVLLSYNPTTGTLFGSVKLEKACRSPALSEGRLAIIPATALEKAAALKAPGGSAALIARTRASSRHSLAQHREALLKAQTLFADGDFAASAQQYAAAIRYFEASVTAHGGLGLCELRRNNVLKAIDSFERAKALAKEFHQEQPELSFHLACAHSRLGDRKTALGHLRQAVKGGFSLAAQMRSDAGLERLFRGDPEFRKLLAQVERAGRLRARAEGVRP